MPQLDSHAAAVVDIVLEYVFGNHTGSVKMSEAAALVGMSVSNFSKYFKRATGRNFSDLVRKLRLAHAGACSNTATKPSQTFATKCASQTCPTSTGIFSVTPAKPPGTTVKGLADGRPKSSWPSPTAPAMGRHGFSPTSQRLTRKIRIYRKKTASIFRGDTWQPGRKSDSRQEHVFLAAIAKSFREVKDYTLNLNSTTFHHGIASCRATADVTLFRPAQAHPNP